MNNLDRDVSIYNKCTSKSTCKFQRKKLEVDNTLGTFNRGDTFTDFNTLKFLDFLLSRSKFLRVLNIIKI